MGKFYARHRTSFSHTHSKRMCHGRHLCWCNDALVAGAVPVAWTRTAPGSIRRCWFIVCFSFLRMAIGAPGRQQVRKRDSKIYIFARGLVRKSHCFVRFFSVSLKTDPARIVDICAEVFEGPLVCVFIITAVPITKLFSGGGSFQLGVISGDDEANFSFFFLLHKRPCKHTPYTLARSLS